jgi:hypothetical protein
MRKLLAYRTQAPWPLLLRFTVPVFMVVLVLALLLGAAPFWAAATAAIVTIAMEPAIDALWRRRHVSITHQNQ